jgi:hypothetical protein
MSAHETHVDTDESNKEPKSPKQITVTVRTPANIGHDFRVRSHDRVDKVVRDAVEYFVSQGQLAAGNYGLAVIQDDHAVEMADAARLEDFDVSDRDVLVLLNKDPQVDG